MAYDRGTAGINAASSAQSVAEAKLPLSGGTMTGPIKDVGGTYTPTPTERYAKSAIVIREADYVGNTRSDIGYAPALAFFWLNRTAGTLHSSSHSPQVLLAKIISSATIKSSGSPRARPLRMMRRFSRHRYGCLGGHAGWKRRHGAERRYAFSRKKQSFYITY